MAGKIHVGITSAKIDCDAALRFVDDPAHGASCLFVGRVRDNELGREVEAVDYDAFEPLAVAMFSAIASEAQSKWDNDLNIWLEHFQGRLEIGGISIVIAVASPHRDEAFQACRYIIENVKSRVPVWKHERYADGESGWKSGQSLRSAAASSHAG